MISVLTLPLGYLDPGTGAIVLQVVVAGLLTAGVVFRKVILFPLTLVRKSKPDGAALDGESSDSADE